MAKKFFIEIAVFTSAWIVGIILSSNVLSKDALAIIAFLISMLILLACVIVLMTRHTKNGILFLSWIRGKWYLLTTGGNLKNRLIIGKNVRFKNKSCMTIGDNTAIGNGAEFFPVENGHPSLISIGKHVVIGDYNRFASMNDIVIEDDVLFAAYVHITDHSHEYRDISKPVMDLGKGA